MSVKLTEGVFDFRLRTFFIKLTSELLLLRDLTHFRLSKIRYMNPMIMVPDSTGIEIFYQIPDSTGYRYVPDIRLNQIPKSWPDIRFNQISGTSLVLKEKYISEFSYFKIVSR